MLRTLGRPIALCAAASLASHAHARSLEQQPARLRPILFFGDLDGTLLGKDTALLAFRDYWQRVEAPAGSVLCYNTGRCIAQYLQGVEHGEPGMHTGRPLCGDLPTPDVLITGDGTEVRWRVDGTDAAAAPRYDLDREWDGRIRKSWWESGLRDEVRRLMDAHDEGLIPNINAATNNLHGGEARHAISFSDAARAEQVCRALQNELGEACHVYTLGGWGNPTPTLVVAIPAIAGKAHAAAHVLRQLGFAREDCVSAGDSNNDAAMLVSGIAFVLVANASGDLVRAAEKAPQPHHYRATAGHADGCVEGIEHFRAARV